jgi:hypothetical protein
MHSQKLFPQWELPRNIVVYTAVAHTTVVRKRTAYSLSRAAANDPKLLFWIKEFEQLAVDAL